MKRNAATRRRDRAILADYGRWILSAAYCVKCATTNNLQLAHIRGRAQGYAKPPPWNTVPLCACCHVAQEVDRGFWLPMLTGGQWIAVLQGIKDPAERREEAEKQAVVTAQEQAEHMFRAYELAQDIGLWARELAEFHTLINQEVAA